MNSVKDESNVYDYTCEHRRVVGCLPDRRDKPWNKHQLVYPEQKESEPHLPPDEPFPLDRSVENKTSSNPKDVAASHKCPLWLLPPIGQTLEAEALLSGANKYGPYNWRKDEILVSTYISAIWRHLLQYLSGEDNDRESGKPHLAHIKATCSIILDSKLHGKLIDNRPDKCQLLAGGSTGGQCRGSCREDHAG